MAEAAALALVLCGLAGGLILVLGLVSPCRALAEPFPGPPRPDARSTDALIDVALIIAFAAYSALGLAVLAIARAHGGLAWRDLIAWHPWRFSQGGRRLWILVVGTLAYGFAADLALRHFYPPSETWFAVPKDGLRAGAILILAVVVAPVVEELIFRGYAYTVLRRTLGLAAALIVTAALFAILHYESTHLYALVVFPVGISLGLIREMTGSVKPAILFHAFNNFLAFGFALFELG